MTPLRILHVVTPSPLGGLERVVTSLVLAQQAGGNDVHVATMARTDAGEAFLGMLAARGISTHAGTAGDRAYWAQRTALSALAEGLRPEVVHTHGYLADIIAAPACRRSGAAVVTTLHGFTSTDLKVRGYEWLQRRTVRGHDAVVAVSDPLARQLARAGVAPDRLEVIPNVPPVPEPRFPRALARQRLGLDNEAWVVGWVGRLSREKGLDIMIDAFARVAEAKARLVVMGVGPEQGALQARANQLGLTPRIKWCGAIPHADRYYPAFDLLVLSSRTEGSPLVLLEAMAAGTPVVATEVGGVPQTVSTRHALLVPPEDPVALATAIGDVRLRPRAAARRAFRAHLRSVQTADPIGWAKLYGEVYRGAIQRRVVAG